MWGEIRSSGEEKITHVCVCVCRDDCYIVRSIHEKGLEPPSSQINITEQCESLCKSQIIS